MPTSTPTPTLDPTPTGAHVSPAEQAGIHAMAEALIARGHLTRQAAGDLLAAELGTPTAQPAPAALASPQTTPADPAPHLTPPDLTLRRPPDQSPAHPHNPPADLPDFPPDLPTELPPDLPLDQLPIDPLFAPPDTPAGYHLDIDPAVPMSVQDITAVRSWFHTLRLPASIAQSIYSETERMSRHPPDAPALDRLTTQTRADLARHWGERTDTMLGHARRLIDAAARQHPGLKPALARGPGSNPLIVRQLAEHAARLYGNAQGQART